MAAQRLRYLVSDAKLFELQLNSIYSYVSLTIFTTEPFSIRMLGGRESKVSMFRTTRVTSSSYAGKPLQTLVDSPRI